MRKWVSFLLLRAPGDCLKPLSQSSILEYSQQQVSTTYLTVAERLTTFFYGAATECLIERNNNSISLLNLRIICSTDIWAFQSCTQFKICQPFQLGCRPPIAHGLITVEAQTGRPVPPTKQMQMSGQSSHPKLPDRGIRIDFRHRRPMPQD